MCRGVKPKIQKLKIFLLLYYQQLRPVNPVKKTRIFDKNTHVSLIIERDVGDVLRKVVS
jgi:hypothetical protein